MLSLLASVYYIHRRMTTTRNPLILSKNGSMDIVIDRKQAGF